MKAFSIISIIWLISALIVFIEGIYTSKKWKNLNPLEEDSRPESNYSGYWAGFMSSLILGPIGLFLLILEKFEK